MATGYNCKQLHPTIKKTIGYNHRHFVLIKLKIATIAKQLVRFYGRHSHVEIMTRDPLLKRPYSMPRNASS